MSIIPEMHQLHYFMEGEVMCLVTLSTIFQILYIYTSEN